MNKKILVNIGCEGVVLTLSKAVIWKEHLGVYLNRRDITNAFTIHFDVRKINELVTCLYLVVFIQVGFILSTSCSIQFS